MFGLYYIPLAVIYREGTLLRANRKSLAGWNEPALRVEYWLWGSEKFAHPEPLQIWDKHLTTRRTSAWILAR